MRISGWSRSILITLFILIISASVWGQQRSLNDYLTKAKQNSPELLNYQNQQAIAQYQMQKVASAYRSPSIYTEGQWMEAPVINGYGYDEAISNGSLYQAIAGVRMPLLRGGQLKAEQNQYLYQGSQEEWLQKRTWHDIRRDVTDQYVQAFADQQTWLNVQNQLHLLQDQVRIAEKLANGGLIKGSDVLLLRIEARSQQIAAEKLKSQFMRGLMVLDSLCSLADTSLVQLTDPNLTIQPRAKDSSQFIEKFSIDSMMFKNELAVFNLKYRPQLSGYADGGLESSNISAIDQHFGFSVGLDLTINIFDGHQRKIIKKIIDLKLQTIQRYKNHVETQQEVQLAGFTKQVQLASRQINLLQQQLDSYNDLLKIYRQELRNGDISTTDYLQVYRQYLQARQDLIDQQKEKYLAINAYNYWNW